MTEESHNSTCGAWQCVLQGFLVLMMTLDDIKERLVGSRYFTSTYLILNLDYNYYIMMTMMILMDWLMFRTTIMIKSNIEDKDNSKI